MELGVLMEQEVRHGEAALLHTKFQPDFPAWRHSSVRCKPATTAAIRYLRSSHGLTASGPAKDRAVRMRMVLLCRTRIGNERAATTVSA